MELKEKDKVERIDKFGCKGVILEIRSETGAGENDNTSKLIKVFWDNGTQSYFAAEKLKVVK